jgi:hypothetical protein
MAWGNYVLLRADPMDYRSVQQGSSLIALSSQLLAVDPTYCAMVSTLDLSRCDKNDGLVPYWSQEFPQAPNLYLGWSDLNGPAHIQEREAGADAVYQALVHFLRVPPRSGGFTPPPGDEPGGGGSSNEDDGGDQNEQGSGGTGVLDPDDALYPGEALSSPDGRFILLYQGDGNLVLYDPGGAPLWASQTSGTAPGVLVMQGDGNLVLYDGNDSPVWHTGTHGFPGARLQVQDDGNVVVYDRDGVPLWATHTAQ